MTRLRQRSAHRSAVLDHAACHQRYYAAGVRPSTERPRHVRNYGIALADDQSTVQTNCLLVDLALNGQSPNYVAELLQPVTELSMRHSSLRLADENALLVSRTSLTFDERVFSIAGPTAWKSFPADIRATTSTPAFKKKLETFLICKII